MVSYSQLNSPGLVISAPYLKVCSCHDWARNHRVLIVVSAPTTHSHHAPWDPGPFNSSLQKLAMWSMRIPQKEVVFILLSIKETQIPIYLILKHSDMGTHMRTHIQIHRATCCSPPPQPEHLHLNGPWLCL